MPVQVNVNFCDKNGTILGFVSGISLQTYAEIISGAKSKSWYPQGNVKWTLTQGSKVEVDGTATATNTNLYQMELNKVVRKFYRDGVEYKIKFDKSWKPGVNTLLYLPLDTNANDASGHPYTPITNGTVTYSSNGIHVTGRSGNYISGVPNRLSGYSNATVCFWLYDENGGNLSTPFGWQSNVTSTSSLKAERQTDQWSQGTIIFHTTGTPSSRQFYYQRPTNTRVHLLTTYDGNIQKSYVNGVLYGSFNCTGNIQAGGGDLQIGGGGYYGTARGFNGYVDEIILENKVRTAQEVSDYYNNTKSNYGL